MSVWSDYDSQLESRGITRRGVALKREQRLLDTKLPASLSYKPVTIDGEEQWVAITRSDNYDEKTIYSRPGEDLTHGGLVRFADNYWLITEKDPDIEVYARAKLVQCNYLLKWIEDGEIIERWCVVEDGTKLKCVYEAHNSLAHWKRCVKTTSFYAGIP